MNDKTKNNVNENELDKTIDDALDTLFGPDEKDAKENKLAAKQPSTKKVKSRKPIKKK